MTNCLKFGPFRLDPAQRLLRRDGQIIPLRPKAFETLLILVENSGRVLEKGELMQLLWPDSFVEEANLTQNISLVRKALGETAQSRRYIITFPGRGYSFVADVGAVAEAGSPAAQPTAATGALLAIAKQEQGTITEADSHASVASEVSPEPEAERKEALAEDAMWAAQYTGARPAQPSSRSLELSRHTIAALVLIVLLAATFLLLSPMRPRPRALAPIRTMAVLPFHPLNNAASDEYFGLGVTDTLIMRLSSLQGIRIIPTNAIIHYAGTGRDPMASGRELRADAVLVGSIQRDADRLRVTTQLLRVSDGISIWADSFDEHFTDIFDVQDRIALRISDALLLQLSAAELRSYVGNHQQREGS